MPWTWTAGEGPVQFLSLPNGYTGGNAVAVSNDRRMIAGNVRVGRVGVSTAAVWRDGSPQILPSTQLWSAVGSNPFDLNVAYTVRRRHPMNNDGSVIVGAAGAPFLANCKATKWVNGVEKQLSTGGIAGAVQRSCIRCRERCDFRLCSPQQWARGPDALGGKRESRDVRAAKWS